MADETLAQELLDILQQGTHYRQVKKGANEGKWTTELVVLYGF